MEKSILDKFVDWGVLKLKICHLTSEMKEMLPYVDARFLPKSIKVKFAKDYRPNLKLTEDQYIMHAFLDPSLLEKINIKRFSRKMDREYLLHKATADDWVLKGNLVVAEQLREHIKRNSQKYKDKEKIKYVDIGPCSGAISTLPALQVLSDLGLVEKTEFVLYDIVPDTLNSTRKGEFNFPGEIVEKYNLHCAGPDGRKYKEFLASNNVKYIVGDASNPPIEARNADFIVASYLIHHLNLVMRRDFAEKTEEMLASGGFIGIADFWCPTFKDYKHWYTHHFGEFLPSKGLNIQPIAENASVPKDRTMKFFRNIDFRDVKKVVDNSYILVGIKRL